MTSDKPGAKLILVLILCSQLIARPYNTSFRLLDHTQGLKITRFSVFVYCFTTFIDCWDLLVKLTILHIFSFSCLSVHIFSFLIRAQIITTIYIASSISLEFICGGYASRVSALLNHIRLNAVVPSGTLF